MSDLAQWQENNARYLSAALAWLRLRLARLAKSTPPQQLLEQPIVTNENQPDGWFDRLRPEEKNNDIARAAKAMTDAADVDPPPALMILGQRLGLSRFEQEILLLCTAMELDTRIPSLYAQSQDDSNKFYPTFALAMVVFDEPAWDALSPDRHLRYHHLIEINQSGAMPFTASPLRADERIVNYIKGLNYLDDRLAPFLTFVETTNTQLPPSQQGVVDSIVSHIKLFLSKEYLSVIQLTGLDSISKQLVAGRAGEALGIHLYRLPVEVLPQQLSELEIFARLWERETLLLPLALYVDAHGAEHGTPSEAVSQKLALLNRFLSRSRGIFFLDTRDVWQRIGETVIFEVSAPKSGEQLEIWKESLDSDSGDIPAILAGQFNLNALAIKRISQSALSEGKFDLKALHDYLWKSCLAMTRPRLEALAQRIDPKATWDDIVLPADTLNLLHQIADQVRQRIKVYEEWGFNMKMNRGLGINALFAGESGTGKTMAAEVIANDLRLDLYRIDLSAVVSKYIGETEKNLRRLFDAAEDGGAILFFDEADALFGKRSEVKDSHDRYANIEINYLLQRMEAYRGLAILATNMKSALDHAFMRRLRFVVNFPFPGTAERKEIWRRVFPYKTPKEQLDLDRLARFNIAGGTISNIAVNAAFLAAEGDSSHVTMPLVMDAMRNEFRKLEKPISEAEFRLPDMVGKRQ